MVSMHVIYEGDKLSKAVHDDSGAVIQTVAPKDIGGSGLFFSPTDLVGAALGSCILTSMGMFAERHELDLSGIKAEVTKEMTATAPRRIAELKTIITVPTGLIPIDQRPTYERIAHSCPVHASLHPDVSAPIVFIYED